MRLRMQPSALPVLNPPFLFLKNRGVIFLPFSIAFVRRKDDAAMLVARADQLKEDRRAQVLGIR